MGNDRSNLGWTFLAGTMIVGAGVLLGTMASSLTAENMAWHRPPQFATTGFQGPASPTDQTSAGQSWARSAFSGGLRRCPEINPGFLAACEAEIEALLARPELPAGTYGGPLLITKIEPMPAEPPPEPYLDDSPPVDPALADLRETSNEPLPTPSPGLPQVKAANYPAAPSEE